MCDVGMFNIVTMLRQVKLYANEQQGPWMNQYFSCMCERSVVQNEPFFA